MNCLLYRNELMEMIRVKAELKSELSNHLLTCAGCKEFFESQTAVSEALNVLKDVDRHAAPDASLQQRLLLSMRGADKSAANFRFSWKAVAVFVISLLCGSIWIYQKEYRQNQSEKTKPFVEANDYVPLTYGMAPGESLQRVRVKLPRSALNDFGIAVKQARTDEITADIIVGESGVPYAIRVVQQSN
jgi:hypothetical protein